MARIAYSLANVGKGHAARALSMVRRMLGRGDQVVLFSGHEALSFIGDICPSKVIPCPSFSNGGGGLSWETPMILAKYLMRAARDLDSLTQVLGDFGPDVCVCDFEPLLPRMAQRVGIPVVSLSSQNCFMHDSRPEMPLFLRAYSKFVSATCRVFVPDADLYISTSFYDPGLGPTTYVGPILRDEVLDVPSSDEGHVVVYLPEPMLRSAGRSILAAAGRRRIISYGGRVPGIEQRPLDPESFVRDVATSSLVIASSGQQLTAECMYLKKKLLMVPIPMQHEQLVNAFFWRLMGGPASSIKSLTPAVVSSAFSSVVPGFQTWLTADPLDFIDRVKASDSRRRMQGSPSIGV